MSAYCDLLDTCRARGWITELAVKRDGTHPDPLWTLIVTRRAGGQPSMLVRGARGPVNAVLGVLAQQMTLAVQAWPRDARS